MSAFRSVSTTAGAAADAAAFADAVAGLDLDWDGAAKRHRIRLPERANIASDTVGRHAAGPKAQAVAVRFEDGDGRTTDITYAGLDAASDRLAVLLRDLGVERGCVVAIHTGARIETVVAHLAVYKLGAIAATLSQLYGPDTVRHVVADSGAALLITQEDVWRPIAAEVRTGCPGLAHILVAGDRSVVADGEILFNRHADVDPGDFRPAATRGEDPALLVYTSGSTGLPKGVLHAHRILHAYKPTLELFNNLELREPGVVFWTAADWAWVGGLIDIVYPALLFGHRLIATQHRFEAEWALGFMERHGVTHILLTPTALNRLAQVARPRERWPRLALRTIFTGGEPLPSDTVRWLHDELRVVCNEGYGMSEVNHMIGNCRRLRPVKPGSMGWEFPGHVAALVDEEGRPVPDGEVGEIVTAPDAPTLFLGYWKRPDLTVGMRLGPWIRTRDLAVRDADGYYWYHGRNDDLIKSAGYRIGPVEVEDVLAQHPAVAEAAVVGRPDPERGQVVKAFVRLAGQVSTAGAGDHLADALREHVRVRLGPYKAPRLIEIVDEFPRTSTGKISRAALRRREQGIAAEGGDEAMTTDRSTTGGKGRSGGVARRAVLGGIVGVAGALAAPAILTGAGASRAAHAAGAQPFAGRTLRVFVYAGPWEKFFNDTFMPRFRQLTGATVIPDPGWWDSIPKLKASPTGQPAFDLVLTDATQGYPAIREGLFQTIDMGRLANKARIVPAVLDNWVVRQGYGITFPDSVMSLAWNKKRVGFEPKGWDDLLKPEARGKVALYNSFYMSLYTFAAMKVAAEGKPGTAVREMADNLQGVFAFAKEQRDVVKYWWPTTTDMTLNLVQQNVALGNMHSTGALPLIRERSEIGAFAPENDRAATQLMWVVPAGTAEKELAEAAIDMLLGEEMQEALARTGHMSAVPSVAQRVAQADPAWAQVYPTTEQAIGGVQYYPYDAYFTAWDEIVATWDREILRKKPA
jgi:acetyl-CoA synthetase